MRDLDPNIVEPERETRSERLADEIAEAVLTGEFEPGRHLDEHMLAGRFGVSRTPVREALRQLASTGLIDLRPRRGAVVSRVTSDQLERLFVAMAEIEATCARLAAMSMTTIERRRLQAFHDHMAESVERDDREAFATANLTFHSLIYSGAHNEILAEFATGLRRRLAPFRRAQFRAAGRLPRSHVEHAAIMRAIVVGEAAAAHTAMVDHMSLVEEAYDQFAAHQG
jgi:DNA-binding GntR family transcriptional regulator